MTRLVVCRHARPGDAAHAAQLADVLRGLPLVAVFTSPLERAVATAAPIAAAHGLEAVVVDDLREIDRGSAEGVPFEALPPELERGLLERPGEVRFPDGESYADLRTRVVAALDDIVASHPNAVVAVVSHSGAIRAALATWLCMDANAIFRFDQRYASVNVVDWTDGTPFVRVVNADRLPPI